MTTLDVYGMCNPLYDLQAEIKHELLQELGFVPGSMNLIDHEAQRAIVPQVYDGIVNSAPGGSGANTIALLSMLGAKTAYTGQIGDDDHGQLYVAGLEKVGIKANLGRSEGNTGICLVLITPDSERTMLTYLGRALDLTERAIHRDDLAHSQYLYITGYLWDTPGQKEAVTAAMAHANATGVKVAFSLSDPFCVGRHSEDFHQLIENHVDVLFGNDAEILALTGKATVREAMDSLTGKCGLVAVTCGKDGSELATASEHVHIDAVPVTAVDATGAGDAYAAGILFGLVRGCGLRAAGEIASLVAGQTVAHLGPRLPSVDHDAIEAIIRSSGV